MMVVLSQISLMLSAIKLQRNFQKWGAAYNSSQNLNYKKSYIEVKRTLDSLILKKICDDIKNIIIRLVCYRDVQEQTLGSKLRPKMKGKTLVRYW